LLVTEPVPPAARLETVFDNALSAESRFDAVTEPADIALETSALIMERSFELAAEANSAEATDPLPPDEIRFETRFDRALWAERTLESSFDVTLTPPPPAEIMLESTLDNALIADRRFEAVADPAEIALEMRAQITEISFEVATEGLPPAEITLLIETIAREWVTKLAETALNVDVASSQGFSINCISLGDRACPTIWTTADPVGTVVVNVPFALPR